MYLFQEFHTEKQIRAWSSYLIQESSVRTTSKLCCQKLNETRLKTKVIESISFFIRVQLNQDDQRIIT